MVRLREIIGRDEKTDIMDVFYSEDLYLTEFYDIYQNLLDTSENYAKLEHEIPYHAAYKLKTDILRVLPVVEREYGDHPNTAVWRMMEEMKWYFGI